VNLPLATCIYARPTDPRGIRQVGCSALDYAIENGPLPGGFSHIYQGENW